MSRRPRSLDFTGYMLEAGITSRSLIKALSKLNVSLVAVNLLPNDPSDIWPLYVIFFSRPNPKHAIYTNVEMENAANPHIQEAMTCSVLGDF